MKTRFAAILIALCLLIGLVGFSPLLAGVMGSSAGGNATPPENTSAPPPDPPSAGASRTTATSPGQAADANDLTPGVTPLDTQSVNIEQDSTEFPDAPLPSLSATNPATALPASVSSVPVNTATSGQTPIRPISDVNGHGPLTESNPAPIGINLRVQEGAFSPSSITVPAGAEVTIVFDNRDVDVRHSVVIYTDRSHPIFKGAAIAGPSTITYTFTAPSTPGEYVLGCGVPTPHPKGHFIVT